MEQEKERSSAEINGEGVYLLYSGGQLAAPSIKGPYSKERAEEILEFDKNSQGGPAANDILTREEAEQMLSENPDQYDDYTDLEIEGKKE